MNTPNNFPISFFHFTRRLQSQQNFVQFAFFAQILCFSCFCLFGRPLYAQNGVTLPATGSGETDSLYREMLASVEGAISISANVRQQIHLFGQEFNAKGTYNELKTTELRGNGATRFRLDLQVQAPADAGETDSHNSITIVCDNTYNFIYRYFSIENEKRLERIEIKRLQEAIEKQGRNDIPTDVGSMFGMGGLAGMLREIRNRYVFPSAPIKTQINEKNSAIAVWKIHGQLKPEIVAVLTGETAGNKLPIPRHTPTAIDIYIGVDDRFPFRFDYFWSADGTETSDEPFAYLLFYNRVLHDMNISETIFDYRPSENILPEDVTDKIINQMVQ